MIRKLSFFAVTAVAVGAAMAHPYALALAIDHGAHSTSPNEGGLVVETVQYLPRSGYTFPRAGGAIVDWCAAFSRDCGWGGAHQFCRSKGFDRALTWDIFHPGRTYVIGSDRYCDGEVCRGFRFIRCG
jgi:hypothetical protein